MSLGARASALVTSPLARPGLARLRRIFPSALTAFGALPRAQGLRFAECLCFILIQAIQSVFSGWQASRVASPAPVADHIPAGLGM